MQHEIEKNYYIAGKGVVIIIRWLFCNKKKKIYTHIASCKHKIAQIAQKSRFTKPKLIEKPYTFHLEDIFSDR